MNCNRECCNKWKIHLFENKLIMTIVLTHHPMVKNHHLPHFDNRMSSNYTILCHIWWSMIGRIQTLFRDYWKRTNFEILPLRPVQNRYTLVTNWFAYRFLKWNQLFDEKSFEENISRNFCEQYWFLILRVSKN